MTEYATFSLISLEVAKNKIPYVEVERLGEHVLI